MHDYINFEKVNCKDCYKCLRNCPVKSMRFANHQAEIIEDECILCGNCYLSCPQGAKEIRDDVDKVKTMFKHNLDVYVSLAPSFIANYPGTDIDQVREALQALGFKDVEETAMGAEMVTSEYEKIVDKDEQKVVISTCCPSVNMLIKKYYPEAVKYMAAVSTPMIAHARKLKAEHQNCSVVFIGPCLAKKAEVDEHLDVIDAALTFQELTRWLESENIVIAPANSKTPKYQTRLYPMTSGILGTMNKNEKYAYFAIDGINKCKEVIEEIISGNLTNCFIEMSSCVGSCVCGPGMDKNRNQHLQNDLAILNYAGDDHYQLANLDIQEEQVATPVEKTEISESIIQILLEKLGKTKLEDELNCGSCGYNTCREKAEAMYAGKTEPSMCLPYLKNKAISYMDDIVANSPNGIIILNDKLEIELINKSACSIFNVKNARDVINEQMVRLTDPTLYLSVLNNKTNCNSNRAYLSQYGKYIEQTVIYNYEFHVIMIIMRDITLEISNQESKDRLSRQTIEITDKVIEKQMRAVQEIASLLGETTAETKVALEKLKESLDD